jgi:predicted component of type VI protein secretion system
MEGECMLGRSRQNNVCILHDEMVSRKHAKILRRNGHYFIHDVGGINFTFINKRVIPQHCDCRLHIDDTVDMGSSTFIVCLIPPTSDACSTEGVEDMQPAAETHAAKC